ncbi:MAG: thiamine phosphate synthase [Myxococcaceae bacterium]
MSKLIDVTLTLILEPHTAILDLIRESVKGGVTAIVLRDKFFNDRDFYEQALLIKGVCRELNVSLIINDRVDVAIAIEANGVHIGKTDIPYHAVRKILPENMSIGCTAESLEDVIEAEKYELDYLGIIPVFPSLNKPNLKQPFGLEGLRKARDLSRHRLLAIGGVKPENAKAIKEAGADGLAVASAICRAASQYEAARTFRF